VAAPARRAPPAARTTAARTTEPAKPDTDDAPAPEEVEVTLRRALVSLERAATEAEAGDEGGMDIARVIAAQRAITQLVGLLAKLTPPPPLDIDAKPDMIAAAKRGREAQRTLLAALLQRAAT